VEEAEFALRRGVTRGKRSSPRMGRFFSLPRSEIFPMLSLKALSRKEPTRLEVIMVQANQSGGTKKSEAFGADAAPAHKTDGDVTRGLSNRDKSDRAGTRNDEQTSKRAKGVGKLTLVPIDAIRADPRNPRKHSRIQVRAIARSIEAFGFNAPILVDKRNQIVAGHGRYEAAQLLGLDRIPVISLDHLTEAQARAYLLADNKLAERSSWDDAGLARQLKELSELALDFDFEAIGFELPEVDLRIQSLDPTDNADRADEFRNAVGPAVSLPGDLWLLGRHRLYCGSALDPSAYELLMANERASAVFTDPPYNLKIDGNVCGSGAVKHREFAMASGEMTREEFVRFLSGALDLARAHASRGAIIYACMDWRHMAEMLAAGDAANFELLNLCVWVKTNGGMGSLYRSRHELVFVFRNGGEAHRNNVQLGRFGRNRTNVWNYPGANSFKRNGRKNDLDLHPTVKPIAMVADAILDSTNLDDVVLDPFLGSGTTLLAAERAGRRCHGVELDPLYVDTAIMRWERLTRQQARLTSGQSFADVKGERRAAN
jgi:DNA modification methylase